MSFEKECLDAHNTYRRLHGVEPLVLNSKLSRDAKTFAEELLHEDGLRNGDVKDLGENIYCVRSTNPNYTITGAKAVEHWYNKESEHDYTREPSDQLPTGNFTQVVWKNSKELGVGFAAHNGKIVVVTRYSPPGNVRTQFCQNVFPPGSTQDAVTTLTASIQDTHLGNSGNGSQSQSGNPFVDACLKAHNDYRIQHGAPPLTLDKNLCRYSQEWADELARLGKMQHRQQSNYGENIYSAWSSDSNYTIDGDKAVDAWYDEIKLHTFGREPSNLSSGHFTQVVWKGSQKLGVGLSKRNGNIYVVCNYSPPGNVRTQYCQNVFPKGSVPRPIKNVDAPQQCPKTSGHVALSGNSFNDACLRAHNNYRRKHGVAPLSLDSGLCQFSQEWADQLARLGKMQHRQQSSYGENIFSAWSSDPNYTVDGNEAVDAWYDEIKLHTFGREPSNLSSGHFTQVVWKGSQKLGVGIAKRNGNIYVVCNYSPPGNYVGQYVSNVPAPL